MASLKRPWWTGQRGEWYVVLQAVLFAIVALAPANLEGFPTWPAGAAQFSRYAGALLMVVGAAMAIAAALHLGDNLTPLPHPREGADFVEKGLYRVVRHPIYCGVILTALGWALFIQGTLTLAYVAMLVVFFDIKARREEVWLERHFAQYAAYRKRVRKLLPFIY